MSRNAIVFGVALILVGIGGFIPHHAPTALIPAYVGIILIICGVIASNPAYRMHAMHGAVLFALLGALAAGGRFLGSLIKGHADPIALSSTGLMTLICGVFVVLCIRSFIAARRAREAGNGG